LNPFYDLIIVNHVLEHLTNGHKVFIRLCELLHTGGVLYAEFPSIRTAYERQTGKTYHFHEDPTHKAFYHLEDLANSAMSVGCKIVSCGPVSPPPLKYMVALPRAIYNSIIGKGFKRFLPNEIRKIDHIMVIKN
jgi:predicted SAM-dependent methyltransferase